MWLPRAFLWTKKKPPKYLKKRDSWFRYFNSGFNPPIEFMLISNQLRLLTTQCRNLTLFSPHIPFAKIRIYSMRHCRISCDCIVFSIEIYAPPPIRSIINYIFLLLFNSDKIYKNFLFALCSSGAVIASLKLFLFFHLLIY